jgi:general secretion pathway protein C
VHSLANRLVEPSKILIIIGIAYTLAMTGWYFVSGPAPLVLSDDKPKAGHIGKPPLSVAEIAARNLFGQARAVAAPAAFDAPETRLRLTLEGIFQAEQPDESAAIVAEPNKPGELFLVGGKLPGNVTLAEVHADRIVLRRNGVLETLRFSDEPPLLTAANRDEAPLPSESSDMSGGDEAPQMPEPSTDVPEAPAEAAADPSSSASLGSVVESYREKLQQDPAATLHSLGVAPVSSSGAQGYRLDNIANSPYLAQTGLQPGDVVLSVNGRPVGDVQSDQAEMANIIAQGSARLEVQRGSRRFFVTASLK